MKENISTSKWPGRVDICVYPDGHWERLGGEDANPPIPESIVFAQIQAFVDSNRPTKSNIHLSGWYSIREGDIHFHWEFVPMLCLA